MTVDEHRVAAGPVVLRICRYQRGHRAPGADVAPVECGGHYNYLVGTLHQGVVDGNVCHFGKQRRGQFLLHEPDGFHRVTDRHTGFRLLE
ncbi:hypothetical protein D3C85_1411550 [compost metagenome]